MLLFQRHGIAHPQICILLIQPEIQKLYWGTYFLISKELHNNQETNGDVFYPIQHNENFHLLCSGGISVGIVTHLQIRRTNQNHPQITGPPLTCQIHCRLTTQLPMASSTTRWIKTPQITWIWVFIGPKIEFYRAITTCFVNLVLLIILTISPNIIHIIIIA